jgi:hypothetical protein
MVLAGRDKPDKPGQGGTSRDETGGGWTAAGERTREGSAWSARQAAEDRKAEAVGEQRDSGRAGKQWAAHPVREYAAPAWCDWDHTVC